MVVLTVREPHGKALMEVTFIAYYNAGWKENEGYILFPFEK